MNTEVCYICGKPKFKTNNEDVFPAAIGGGYIINKFCAICNSIFGKRVDAPFINLFSIGRSKLSENIKRGVRDIKDPFKENIITINGKKFTTQMNSNGEGVPRLIPIIPNLDTIEKGEKFEIEVDARDMHIPKKIVEKLLKKHGLIYEYKETKRSHFQPTTFLFWDSNNTFLLGVSKMLFESAAEMVPEYADSNTAKKFANMLLSGEIDYSLGNHLNPSSTVVYSLMKDFRPIFLSMKKQHVILLIGVRGVGLVGLIKIFDEMCVIILSEELRYSYFQPIFIFNDFKKVKAEIYQCNGISGVNVVINDKANYNNELFSEDLYKEKPIEIYDCLGIKQYNSPIEIANDFRFPQIFLGDFKSNYKSVFLVKNRLTMKSKYQGKYIPIMSIVISHSMEQIK